MCIFKKTTKRNSPFSFARKSNFAFFLYIVVVGFNYTQIYSLSIWVLALGIWFDVCVLF